MTASGISQILFFFLLISSTSSFGNNSLKKTCKDNLKESAISELLASSKKMVAKTETHSVDSLPNDPRTEKIRKEHPAYNAIGILKTRIGRGSAWLTNDCLVWTAKHVIGEHKKIIGETVTFYVGQPDRISESEDLEKNFKLKVKGTVVASANPEGKRRDGGAEDWALVKLEKSIGEEIGVLPMAQFSVEDTLTCDTLEIAGYPGEKSTQKLWWQGNCLFFPETSGPSAFNLGCPITKGNSGGPLLCWENTNTDEPKVHAIGIAMQARSGRPYTESFALNFTSEWPKVKAAYLKYKNTCK